MAVRFEGWEKVVTYAKDISKPSVPLLRRTSEELRNDIQDHFQREEGPAGSWQELSDMTKAIRRAKGRDENIKLKQTGRLRSSIKIHIGKENIELGTNLSYARLQQDGGRSETGKIVPARSYLWYSRKAIDKALDLILDFLKRS